MNNQYVSLSLELNLFFGRIMKEHSFFLMAGFPAKNANHIRRADWFRKQFEALLSETVSLSNRRVSESVLQSGEVVTIYTASAEQRTAFLSGIPIDSRITAREHALRSGCEFSRSENSRCETSRCETSHCEVAVSAEVFRAVRRLNQRALRLVKGLISFKEQLLRELSVCRLFTFNYPLLIEHILREAKLYCSFLVELESTGTICKQNALDIETFWNQIMMEHALFIRGLLDPTENVLIQTANDFVKDYQMLLEEAREKDSCVCSELEKKSLEETLRYRDFKAAGTKGITECKISGLILPLLADHVLREANHYLRLLNSAC